MYSGWRSSALLGLALLPLVICQGYDVNEKHTRKGKNHSAVWEVQLILHL